jgi:hypothetical protein
MTELEMFRALCPEFAATPDEKVNIMIELARPHVSAERFGQFYSQALAYRAAHTMAMQALALNAGSTSPEVIGGDVISEKEGDLQRQYAQYMNSQKPDSLDRTYYGRELKTLARQCIVPVMNRMGEG